ncbi:hypothetical protein PSEUBRA_000450 [Kalmanozyma brasiliensis GHG001]|uniref:Uncharacterized protein n=1 Tax=Kalmanozyma brasiliensis (strain GHG001) TaxID=1365824 RepID=V5GW06_KALBG|nr:uncharacterized protein PSEUBRA_000450 [Kalmanozyma brasiliensis GHG001]EST10047.1 hypothetical protein PSEUBRA_000450 [Kalmanozyma brasiliensis GHG001]
MPHKRAKHSDRVAKRFSLGQDLAPGANDGFFSEMPKGAMRILQGAKVQEAHRAKLEARKKAEQDALTRAKGKAKASEASTSESNDKAGSELTIRPGEKLRDFNARVEQAMAGDVRASFRSATRSQINARKRERRKLRAAGIDPDADPEDLEQQETTRKAKADKAAALQASEPSKNDLKRQRQTIQQTGEIKDFAKASQVKKINDVAQAPPTLTRAPRGESVQAKTRKARLMAKITGNDEEEAERKVKQAEKARQKGRVPEKLAAANASATNSKKRKAASGNEAPAEPSMARQRVLDEERQKAIKAYRQIKEKKIQESEVKRAKRA